MKESLASVGVASRMDMSYMESLAGSVSRLGDGRIFFRGGSYMSFLKSALPLAPKLLSDARLCMLC